MTGSKAQLYNGIALISIFFSCRLIWGTVQSARVWVDMWRAIRISPDAGYTAAAHGNTTLGEAAASGSVMALATNATPIPVWLAGAYVASNLVLNVLNWHWFLKMIKALRKRLEPPKEAKELRTVDGVAAETTATDNWDDLRKRHKGGDEG
jgi:hypothetical protein